MESNEEKHTIKNESGSYPSSPLIGGGVSGSGYSYKKKFGVEG